MIARDLVVTSGTSSASRAAPSATRVARSRVLRPSIVGDGESEPAKRPPRCKKQTLKTPARLTVAAPPNSFSFLNVVCRCSSTVEHLICNQVVASSILAIGLVGTIALGGEVPEWPKGADCKSAGLCLRRFESSPLHQYNNGFEGESGNSSVGRARAFQARGRGFESRFPLQEYIRDGSQRRQFFWRKFFGQRLVRLSSARM